MQLLLPLLIVRDDDDDDIDNNSNSNCSNIEKSLISHLV